MLDNEHIRLVLRYAVALAGNEDDFQRRELGPIHLIKYLYLADLAYAEQHRGETLTGLTWRFHHFGPWAAEAFEEIPQAMALPEICRRSFQGRYQDDVVRYRATPELEESLEDRLPWVVARALKRAVHEFSNDTSSLLHHVYCTEPMLAAAPGEILDFSPGAVAEGASPEVRAHQPEGVPVQPPHTTRSHTDRKRRRAAHEELRTRFQAAIKHRLAGRPAEVKPQPRYDEVFAKGQEWLDRQAGEPLASLEGELIVADEVWKSRARSQPDLS